MDPPGPPDPPGHPGPPGPPGHPDPSGRSATARSPFTSATASRYRSVAISRSVAPSTSNRTPARTGSRGSSPTAKRTAWLGDDRGPGLGQRGGDGRRVVDLEGDPEVSGHPLPDLHPVDVLGVPGIGEFQRGHAGVQDGHPPVRRGVGGAFRQAQHIPVEAQRLVVVRSGHHQAELADRRMISHPFSVSRPASGDRAVHPDRDENLPRAAGPGRAEPPW